MKCVYIHTHIHICCFAKFYRDKIAIKSAHRLKVTIKMGLIHRRTDLCKCGVEALVS